MAYRFAEAHKNERYAYLNIESYREERTLEIIYSISRISNIIKKNKKFEGNSISYYVKKYDDVPIWVIVDFLDFGDLRSIISCLPISIQNKIARDLCDFINDNIVGFKEIFPPETMNSFIRNIHEVRNISAHNNRLLDFHCRADTKYFLPLHNKYNISVNDDRKSIYSTFLSLQCFLSHTEFCVLNNSIRKRTRHLANNLKSISINDILCLLGFPNDWNKLKSLNQSS